MENQKTKIISIASIIALALTLVTATYAYFMAQTGEGKSTDIKINANTVDTFTFEAGSALNLSLNQENFASGKGNQTGTTFAKAMLTANNKTNTATEHYYLYLNISNNTFTYSIDNNTPEILLSIKDGSNNEITTLTGLTYKTVTDGKGASIKGFDITTKSGLITILNNREITTTSSKTEQWNVTVTFVNYNSNQAGNAGKNFTAKLMIQKEKITLLADWVISQYTGTQGDNALYYHNSTLTNGAGDNSYRYAGGDYVLTEKATTAGMKSLTSSSDTDTDGITNFYCDGERQYLYDLGCDTNSSTYYFTLQYDTTNTQYQTYNEALEKAVSDGYLTKDNVKNFVCFGSGVSPCPTENLYRIIGVFDNKVKLMKYTYNTKEQLGEDGDFSQTTTLADWGEETTYRGNSTTLDIYYWNDSTKKNTWSESLLNKINLNTNFINYIGTEWSNKIVTTTWKVGGNTWVKIGTKTPSVAYTNEITSPDPTNSTDNATEYSAKVGLMYVSDYGFAASPSAWTTTLNNYNGYDDNNVAIKDTNWMFIGSYDWTISRLADGSGYAFGVGDDGYVYDGYGVISALGVRASFSLESSVSYVSGSGSMSDPIRIN